MSVLTGYVVVVTRKPFGSSSRFEVNQIISSEGATVENAVTSRTTFVLTDDAEIAKARRADPTMTTKAATAYRLGLPLLTGADFRKLTEGKPLSQLGFHPPQPAAKAPTKAAAKAAERAQRHSLANTLEGCFPLEPAGPFQASF